MLCSSQVLARAIADTRFISISIYHHKCPSPPCHTILSYPCTSTGPQRTCAGITGLRSDLSPDLLCKLWSSFLPFLPLGETATDANGRRRRLRPGGDHAVRCCRTWARASCRGCSARASGHCKAAQGPIRGLHGGATAASGVLARTGAHARPPSSVAGSAIDDGQPERAPRDSALARELLCRPARSMRHCQGWRAAAALPPADSRGERDRRRGAVRATLVCGAAQPRRGPRGLPPHGRSGLCAITAQGAAQQGRAGGAPRRAARAVAGACMRCRCLYPCQSPCPCPCRCLCPCPCPCPYP